MALARNGTKLKCLEDQEGQHEGTLQADLNKLTSEEQAMARNGTKLAMCLKGFRAIQGSAEHEIRSANVAVPVCLKGFQAIQGFTEHQIRSANGFGTKWHEITPR